MFILFRQNLPKPKILTSRSAQTIAGFTLIELMITIAILAILVAIVVPSYNAQVRKSGRADAVTSLSKAAQALERCRSDTLAYNNAACTDYTGGVASDRGLYTITAADIAGNAAQAALSFTLRADPVAGTTQAADNHCAVFTIDHTGLRFAQDDTGTDATTECWR